MKKEITGYIQGVINSYSRTIERLKVSGVPITSTNSFQSFKEEFSDLLEFVIDIPEEKEESIMSFNIALENGAIKRRITELEEFCENLNEVEGNLHREIEKLNKEKNQVIENVMDLRRARDADYENFEAKEIMLENLKIANKQYQIECSELTNKIEKLTGPLWFLD